MSPVNEGYIRLDVASGDVRFPSFLQGFNRRWLAPECEAVFLCFTTEGVAAALEAAIRDFGNAVRIKGGGHCYEGFVFNDGTRAIIDLSPMNGVGIDAERGYYLEAGGTNWSAFEALFNQHGKVLPAGSCYSVGLGGHICGGGYGLLSRLHGLTVDWLTGVEVVVKDSSGAAHAVYASKGGDGDLYDLYWASCGGGGGNFGVITRYYFEKLPDAPRSALISTLSFDWKDLTAERLGALLGWYAEQAARDDNLDMFGLFKLNHEQAGEIHLVLQWASELAHGDLGEVEDAVRGHHRDLSDLCPHREPRVPVGGHPGWYTVPHTSVLPIQSYTFYEAVQNLNGSGPNQRGKYKSAYMRKGFPPDQVEAIFDNLRRVPPGLEKSDMKQNLLQVDTYGGQINTVKPTETAIPQRSSIFKLQYQAYWTSPNQDDAQLDWIRQLYMDAYHATGGTPNPALDETDNVDGCYYNYPDVDLNEIVGRNGALELYFQDNLRENPRNLVAVKRRWDPNNYFRSTQSIPLE